MAIATETNGRLLPAGPAPAAWSTGGDRSHAFAKARRHSMVVRWLKVLLPIGAVAVLSSYGIFVQHSFSIGDGRLKIGPVAFSSDVLTMHNPRYEGYSKDGSRFSVTARTAEQDIGQKDPIKLSTIEGTIVQPDNTATSLRATRGVFDSKSNELDLFDAIDIQSSGGMSARLTRATIFLKESKIISNEPVTVETATGTLRGNSMVLLQKAREVAFSDGVVAHLTPRRQAGPDQAGRPASRSGLIGAGDGPVDVTAPRLVVKDDTKTAVFSGNVRAEQDGAVLTASALEVSYDGGGEPADKASRIGPANPADSRIKHILARENVVLTRGSDRVTADLAEFDTSREISVLTGAVAFASGPDRQALADRVDLDFKSETALLTGDVTVLQGKNSLKGRRLLVDRKAGTMHLSVPGEPGRPAGRIASRFHQPDAKPARQDPAGQNSASAGNGIGLRFRTDPNAPIDIEADVLDVDDKARTATFRGDVQAAQGDFHIRTVELVATYSGQAGVDLMQPRSDAEAKSGAAQLQRVQARKKVVITSKDDQSATGDWADFDVKANTVVLGGDVTLTQGRNVVRGPRLVIDMTTGLSRMEASRPSGGPVAGAAAQPGSEAGNPGPAGWPAGNCGGRTCAVFYPKDAKDMAQRGIGAALGGARTRQAGEGRREDKQAREPEAASSWSSTTSPSAAQP